MDGHSWRWWTIRVQLVVATAVPVLIALLWLLQPQFVGDPRPATVFRISGAVLLAGFALAVIGAAWTWRIWRADLEADTPPWRYRDRR
jgi:hypothetical protein